MKSRAAPFISEEAFSIYLVEKSVAVSIDTSYSSSWPSSCGRTIIPFIVVAIASIAFFHPFWCYLFVFIRISVPLIHFNDSFLPRKTLERPAGVPTTMRQRPCAPRVCTMTCRDVELASSSHCALKLPTKSLNTYNCFRLFFPPWWLIQMLPVPMHFLLAFTG